MIRSRTRWMEHGEKSPNYFCNLEKRSSEKKIIYRLKRDDDSIISSDIMNEIHSFYQAFYSLLLLVVMFMNFLTQFLVIFLSLVMIVNNSSSSQFRNLNYVILLFLCIKIRPQGTMVCQLSSILFFGLIFMILCLILTIIL